MRDWSSPAWLAEATDWLDERLIVAGLERTGGVVQHHLRPWATTLRAPTTGGTVWLKAASPGTASEVGLYGVLAEAVPEAVLVPLAIDRERAWILLPDGGPTLGDRLGRADAASELPAALARYGALQRAVEPRADELLALGVADMRPAAMPGHYEHVLEIAAAGDRDLHERLAAGRTVVAEWCARLADAPGAPSLDHNDLHPWNVLGNGDGYRFYDWGDAVVAHPFTVARVPLGYVRDAAGSEVAARDAYLEAFADLAPHGELVETLELACRVAKIARVLIWERSLRAALDEGVEVDATWLTAPLESAASIFDDDYLGGA